jgi:hypothetical protein
MSARNSGTDPPNRPPPVEAFPREAARVLGTEAAQFVVGTQPGTEVQPYASICCRAVFVSGVGPDNIREISAAAPPDVEVATGPDRTRDAGDAAAFFSAYRAGDCPCCGAANPAMEPLS